MKKLSFLTILALLLCTSCSSCHSKADSQTNDQPATSQQALNADDAKPQDAEQDQAKQDQAKPDTANPETATDDTPKNDAQQPAITEKSITLTENNVSINAHYPVLGQPAIDNAIESEIQKSVKEAQERLSVARKEDTSFEGDYEYSVTFEIVRSTPDYADVVFTHGEYTGGAHGSAYINTRMYDKDGKIIDPWSIIPDRDELLPKLSEFAFNDLKKQLSDLDNIDDMIHAGTEGTPENFQNIVRTDDGIRIYFQPYSVAPWSAGILHVDYKM